jgi:hypothetical protein
MRFKSIIITLLVSLTILCSCAPRLRVAGFGGAREETCPVAMRADYHMNRKSKIRFKSKRKPTPSLIHITRVSYKKDRNFGY